MGVRMLSRHSENGNNSFHTQFSSSLLLLLSSSYIMNVVPEAPSENIKFSDIYFRRRVVVAALSYGREIEATVDDKEHRRGGKLNEILRHRVNRKWKSTSLSSYHTENKTEKLLWHRKLFLRLFISLWNWSFSGERSKKHRKLRKHLAWRVVVYCCIIRGDEAQWKAKKWFIRFVDSSILYICENEMAHDL